MQTIALSEECNNGCPVEKPVDSSPSVNNTNLSAVRLIAWTELSGREHEEASRRAGFESHLVKPVALFEIERIIGRGVGFLGAGVADGERQVELT